MKNIIKYEVYLFLRIAITGKESGPDLREIVKIIGIDETFERINNFCDRLLKKDRFGQI
mgnify:FL=1